MSTAPNRQPNRLIHETSPYLLQHAYNPVQWLPFGDEAFALARKQNKPLLISIGYSACHWCHVMEHESFEDPEVAAIMNRDFINVKVDREERSDVDMLYMQAVQLMTGRGGWPLNCFVLPDGRPFYGGTYFQKTQWINVLNNLAGVYTNDREKVLEYATRLTEGIQQSEVISTGKKSEEALNRILLHNMVSQWKERWDRAEGGPNRAPKFPLPNNYRFLLRYALLEKDEETLEHLHLTLRKMAFGGLYDQLHGGFARYSTDTLWKVPHFEKMLYDNAQLVSLYAEAYSLTRNELYREVALETLDFVEQEWFVPEGYFYSAFDADSDGEEGKYYVWRKEDLQDLLGDEYPLFAAYYLINDTGYWEHGNYILMRAGKQSETALQFGISHSQLHERIAACKQKLKQEVKSRIKPGLDDKTVTSWNAMMCSACAQAYLAFGLPKHKHMALASANFINTTLSKDKGFLFRTYKNGEAKIDGFLDDYAFVIEANLNAYVISANEQYLQKARELSETALRIFHNPDSHLLFYTAHHAPQLAARTSEVSDNVMPSGNSQMAINLFVLGHYFALPQWIQKAENMLGTVLSEMPAYGAGYSNWGCLALHLLHPFNEVAIVGKDVDEKLLALSQQGLTNTILAVQSGASELPLVKNRYVEGRTLYYVCVQNTCLAPVSTAEEALQQLG